MGSFQVWLPQQGSHCSCSLKRYTQMWLQLCSPILAKNPNVLIYRKLVYSVKQQGIKEHSKVQYSEIGGDV